LVVEPTLTVENYEPLMARLDALLLMYAILEGFSFALSNREPTDQCELSQQIFKKCVSVVTAGHR